MVELIRRIQEPALCLLFIFYCRRCGHSSTLMSKSFVLIEKCFEFLGQKGEVFDGGRGAMPFLPVELETASQAPRSAQTGPCQAFLWSGAQPPLHLLHPVPSYLCLQLFLSFSVGISIHRK